jgi:electron transfer flavoprotein-quinone oxidoreductase
MNLGYTVRGMDLAIASGQIAGQAAIKALDANDTSKAGLQCYKTMLDESFIMRDLKQYQNFPAFMEECPRLFNGYGEMIRDIMNPLFIVDGEPRPSIKKMAMGPVKNIGLFTLAKDVMKGVKAL